jgi:hypothetical protein
MDGTPQRAGRKVQNFSDWLANTHRGGAFDNEITAKLAELVERVDFLKKPGSITISIAIKPGEAGADYFHVIDDVTTKLPVPDREVKVYWPEPQTHGLVRSDPSNVRMFPDAKNDDDSPTE